MPLFLLLVHSRYLWAKYPPKLADAKNTGNAIIQQAHPSVLSKRVITKSPKMESHGLNIEKGTLFNSFFSAKNMVMNPIIKGTPNKKPMLIDEVKERKKDISNSTRNKNPTNTATPTPISNHFCFFILNIHLTISFHRRLLIVNQNSGLNIRKIFNQYAQLAHFNIKQCTTETNIERE